MNSPLQAMIWELWRTSFKEMMMRLAFQCGAVFFFLGFPIAQTSGSPEAQVVSGIFVMVLMIGGGASQTWILEFDSQQTSYRFRLSFVRPVSTLLIVAAPMLFTMLVAVVSFLLPALMYRTLVYSEFPIKGPLIVITSVIPCFMAATWGPTTRLGKGVSLAFVILAMIACVVMHEFGRGYALPILMAIGEPAYFQFPWPYYVFFLLVGTSCFWLTVAGVNRQRCGERFRIFPERSRQDAQRSSRSLQKPFGSPMRAQCWYEFRRFGPVVLIMAGLAPLVFLIFAFFVNLANPVAQNSAYIWLGVILVCPIVYQIVGVDGALGLSRRQGGEYFFPPFDAARAISNEQLIVCKMLVIAVCSLLGMSAMVLAAGVHGCLAPDDGSWSKLGQLATRFGGQANWQWLIGVCNIFMLYNASSCILFVVGLWAPKQGRWFAASISFVYLNGMLAVWDWKHDWSLRLLWQFEAYAAAFVIVALSVFIFGKAAKAGSLRRPFFLTFCGFWLIYVISTINVALRINNGYAIPLAVQVLAAGMLITPLAAVALAPLSLASARHA